MAGAYAALLSLVQLLHPDEFPRHHRYPEIKLLYNITDSLRSSLAKIFPVPKKIKKRLADLNSQIREAIYKAQDIIEYFIFSESLSSEIHPGDLQSCSVSSFVQELVGIIADVDPLAKEAEEIAHSIKGGSEAHDLSSQTSADQQDQEPGFSIKNKNTVGQDKDLILMKGAILSDYSNLQVIPITGLCGIGKTTLAQSVYGDPEIKKEFSFRGWVTASQDDQDRDILSKLWSSMEIQQPMSGEIQLTRDDRRDLLKRSLYEKKYLIVVDDVRDTDVWDLLRSAFPNRRNGSRIVITTRDMNVAEYSCRYDKWPNPIHRMEPLDDEYSWYLLCEIAFGDRSSCPPHLKDISQRISENCHGLPLSLRVVGGLLSRVEQTEEDWKRILQDTNAAAEKSDEAYLDILSLGYHNLPIRLKACFLYMGAFPQDTEIRVSKLINLWVAEGFLVKPKKLTQCKTVEHVASEYLEQLIDRNLVVVHKMGFDGRAKACGLHNSLRHVATQECEKEMFFHSRKRRLQQLSENTSSQRRISVHKNYLMCVKQVHESAQSIVSARTLLYAGPYHQRPLPFSLTLDLLRVLDAFTVYFLDFPNEIVKLIHLRYLSLTYNDVLPSSISKLQKLQILIVRRLPRIIFLGESFLPVEIWNMPQLRHLIFTESDFPIIPSLVQGSVLLENLQTLKNVSAYSCTKENLQNMPNLKKLGMWIEASGGAVGLHLNQLQQLESFKFTVLEPTPRLMVEVQPKLYFPKSLRKLTLSGCGLPWEDMTVIGQLPALEVLKLREMAFQGDEWCPNTNEFVELKFLLLEYLDLQRWKAYHFHFPKLKQLILRHCYKLEEIPREIANIGGLRLIEVVGCSSGAVYSAEDIVEDLAMCDRDGVTIRTSLVGEDMGYP